MEDAADAPNSAGPMSVIAPRVLDPFAAFGGGEGGMQV